MPLYGWSEKGAKTYAEKLAFKTSRVSMVAGYHYDSKEMLAPFEYKGYTDQYLCRKSDQTKTTPLSRNNILKF